MQARQNLHVEVYAHGGWWKDSNGQTGQVPETQAKKGPLATVAVVTNRFGLDGWELIEVVSQPHSVYRLVFKLAFIMEDADQDREPGPAVTEATHPG
jgi:hypothetical protein